MADEKRFAEMLAEFRRVGVDPDTFSAMLSITPDEALGALAALPDGAGPAAFLAQLRQDVSSGRARSSPSDGVAIHGEEARGRLD